MTPEGKSIQVHGNIDRRKCGILANLIQELKPIVTLEVGLAYGVSALAICDALFKTTQTKHIVIDPHQNIKPIWGGIGLYNLKRAGFRDLIEFYEQPSYRALPMLESADTKIDFAFIDGWHTFDYTLVDFFYIDKMLKEGGFVVFDDADWPSVRNVCRFVATNLDYKLYNSTQISSTTDENTSVHSLKTVDTTLRSLSRLLNTFTGYDDESQNASKDVKLGLSGNFIAFKKCSHDSRKWNHFISF